MLSNFHSDEHGITEMRLVNGINQPSDYFLIVILTTLTNVTHQAVLSNVMQQIRPKGILLISEVPLFDLIDFAQQSTLRHLSSVEESLTLLKEPLDFDGVIILSHLEPKIVATLLSSTAQHNIVHNLWILADMNRGQREDIWKQLWSLKKFKGFSAKMKMFCIYQDNAVSQIIGNGYANPLIKDCGFVSGSCDLSQAIKEANSNVNYHGQEIVVSFEHAPPHSIQNKDGTMEGILVNAVKHLGIALNLTRKYQQFRERFIWANKLENGTWSGNLGDIVSGMIHTSVAGYLPSIERAEVVDFTIPVVTEIGGYIIKRPGNDDFSLFIYLSQFMPRAWLFISMAFMISLCLMITLMLSYNKQVSLSIIGSSMETIYLAMINKVSFLVQMKSFLIHVALTNFQSPKMAIHSTSQRVLMFTLFLMSLLLMSCYKSQLKATLAVQTLVLPINNLEEILSSDLDLLLKSASYLESGFQLAPKGSLMNRIYDKKLHGKKRVQEIGGMEASLKLVEEGKAIYASGIDTVLIRPQYPCKIIDIKSLRLSHYEMELKTLLALATFF